MSDDWDNWRESITYGIGSYRRRYDWRAWAWAPVFGPVVFVAGLIAGLLLARIL